jgi:hypothetical protein
MKKSSLTISSEQKKISHSMKKTARCNFPVHMKATFSRKTSLLLKSLSQMASPMA